MSDVVLDTLKGGLEKIQQGWTTDYLARDRDGNPVAATSPKAVSWCVEGAFLAAEHNNGRTFNEAMKACGKHIPESFEGESEDPIGRVIRYNNSRENAEPIVEMIKAAIKEREERPEPVPA